MQDDSIATSLSRDSDPENVGDAGREESHCEHKEVINLCRSGRLYEVEKWIAAGKPLDFSASVKSNRCESLLSIAVGTGFYSLVELIAKHETSQSSKNLALQRAVSSRRLDLVELLLAHGAEIRSVPLADVLLDWEPKMIRYFLDHGADPINDRPFAEAFGGRIRTVLRPFIEYRQTHPELATQLQEQLDCALRYFCSEGNLKWVCLLIWAGGDPRSSGPCLNKDYTEDPECYTTGFEEACRAENADVLKKLKPNPSRDDFPKLLHEAAMWGRKATLDYLLAFGTNPNDKRNGGSSALDAALWDLNFAGFNPYAGKSLKPKYAVSNALDCVGALLSHGAIWNPEETDQISSLRSALAKCEPSVTIALLQLFRQYKACPAERVHKLLGTPRMKEHLKSAMGAVEKLGIRLEKPRQKRPA